MVRFVLALLLLVISLLTVLPIPAKQVWYLAIAVEEFPWVWMIGNVLLLIRIFNHRRYRISAFVTGILSLLLFSVPLVEAASIGYRLDNGLADAFGATTADLQAPHRAHAFSLSQMITGIGAKKVAFTAYQYGTGEAQSLHFYPSQIPGVRPCLIVVHGGSWKSGNNGELPDVDWYFAKAGYNVAAINYRLAGEAKSPAPQEDVHAAFTWLRAHAGALYIDTTKFVLLGRSAGGQIVLTAAYSLHEPGLRGVVSFYGPTDMFFAYNSPHNQLVMKHQEVMRAFFGGSPGEVPQKYLDGSPVRLVTPQSVPTLLVHGMLDQHVHYIESQLLSLQLQKAGVPHLLLGLPWATHGCEYTLNGPSGQLSVYAVERFLWAVTQGKAVKRVL